ncbi:MAG: hypothetical protein IJ784_14945 [Ruminiclostridium sp.]|nr:hypothetical protein [Ruminiclostridium sp.]
MNSLLYLNIALTVFAAGSFIYGALHYLRPRKPLYASMIVVGVGCIMLGRIYLLSRLLAGLAITGIFHVGILGTIGAFGFFYSSNYGQIDSLVDDGSKDFMKYRIIAVSGILITAALYVAVLMSPASLVEKISDGVTAASIAAASYYHVKHIFVPDVDYGVVSCLRLFNILAFFYGALCMGEMAALAYSAEIPLIVICSLQCIVSAALIPVMDRGVRSWSK